MHQLADLVGAAAAYVLLALAVAAAAGVVVGCTAAVGGASAAGGGDAAAGSRRPRTFPGPQGVISNNKIFINILRSSSVSWLLVGPI